MSGVQKCEWEPTKILKASDGVDVFARWFGMSEADIEARAGRFVRGANKGKLRGWIVYRKVRVGGWCFPLGGVMKPGMIFAHFCPTYDEAQETANLTTDRFFPAERVDTCYGHDPAKTRQEAVARLEAQIAKASEEEVEKRRAIAWATVELMEENGVNDAAIKAYQNAKHEFIVGGWPAWHAYNDESLALSAAAAGGSC